MKNLQKVLEQYRDDARVQRLAKALEQDSPARLQLEGLVGSMDAFVLCGTYLSKPQSHLYIAADKEEAAYLQNDLSSILDKKPVRFFPDSFKRPASFEDLNNTNILQRTEAINQMSVSKAVGEIVVTYPEALFEKVVAPQALEKTRINFTKGESIDVDFIVDVLVEYGFERTDFVYEPGQFSLRGGIMDIFSFGNEWPYRVELFDDEVESIRVFDPSNQLSIRNISKVSIVPNMNSQFDKSQKVSLLKILPENCCVWVKDFQMLLDKLQICFEKASELADKIIHLEDKEQEAELLRERAFIRPNEIIQDILYYPIFLLKKGITEIPLEEKVIFAARPQPSFNKNFKLLIDNLESNVNEGFENYILTDNTKQIERFYSIFEDLEAKVAFHPINKAISKGFIDLDMQAAFYTDHQIFQRFHRYRLRQGFTKSQALNLKLLRELQPGDFVTHIDHGIGKYSGLQKLNINGNIQESVRLLYKNNDVLYVGINSLHKISKYVSKEASKLPALSKLGSDAWERMKRKTKKKIKDIAQELIVLYAKRRASEGHAFAEDGYLQNELEASFLYEDTPDQYKATVATKADMQKKYPMDRLICGDVGFGKTEIAIRAAFKAVVGGKQVAVLVPTTILALQHHKTFSERLKEFGVTVEYVNRFKTAKQKREIYERLKKGEIDIIIGTHAILSKQVGFKDLGLLVVDEEQKFGVAAKEKLRNLKVNVDTLTLTATPIPRTLQFSLMSARDLSVIRTAPPNRQPIHTEVRVFNNELIKESIYYEIYRGGQVFFVHNRVKTLPDIVAMIRRACPDVDVASAHGQMEPKELEKTLIEFIDRKYDVLVCTNIIETGLDIPNANTIIINNAHHFGMSDLHQLRGRVGRSNRKAYCYLFCPPMSTLTSDARKRLKTIEEFSDLGSGFDIAMKDLDIRGAGNLLGGEQSGFIADIGFETYQKILDEAIQELKETKFKDLFKEELAKERTYVRDVVIEADIEMLIPDTYVKNTQERLSLYKELDSLENEEQIEDYMRKLTDRFGKIPHQVKELFNGLRLRWLCKALGFERMIVKGNKLRCYFISNPQSAFYETQRFNNIMQFVNKKVDRTLGFKQSAKHFFLVKEGIKNLRQAEKLLSEIEAGVKAME